MRTNSVAAATPPRQSARASAAEIARDSPTASLSELAAEHWFDGVGSGTTGTTVIAACPVTPSLLAVTDTVPAALPETSPVWLTVALVGSDDDQVTVRPESGLPAASSVAAESCDVE